MVFLNIDISRMISDIKISRFEITYFFNLAHAWNQDSRMFIVEATVVASFGDNKEQTADGLLNLSSSSFCASASTFEKELTKILRTKYQLWIFCCKKLS